MSTDYLDHRALDHRTGDIRAGRTGRAERLVRAAVSAFCSLTRPSRREIAQLDDLAAPLFASLSVESKRFIAAALSECSEAPPNLVRRLCEEPVEVAAPLLTRSRQLGEIDLVAIAARQGALHAGVIARRPGLAPGVARLVADAARTEARRTPEEPVGKAAPANSEAVEQARRKLRSMMVPAGSSRPPLRLAEPQSSRDTYDKLRATALTGVPVLFQTALADALGIDFPRARALFAASGYFELLAALRFLGLSGEQAFVLAVAAYPDQFAHAEAVRLFLERFSLLHPEAAQERVRGWKAQAVSAMIGPRRPANDAADASPAPAPVRATSA